MLQVEVDVIVLQEAGAGGAPGAAGGFSPRVGASAWENIKYYLSGQALHDSEAAAAAAAARSAEARGRRRGGGGRARSQGRHARGPEALYEDSLEELVAEDEAGEGPLAGEAYEFRVRGAEVDLGGGRRVDVSEELGGVLRSSDVEGGGSSGSGAQDAGEAVRARASSQRGGRVIDAEWREKP
jgi:hypothetical protein